MHTKVRADDPLFLGFLEAQLIRTFSICGEVGGRCAALEAIVRDLKNRKPIEFEQILERIIRLYEKMTTIEEWRSPTVFTRNTMPNPYFNRRRKPKEVVPVV
jgi:arginine deiminase